VLGSGSGTNCEAILEACVDGRIPGQVVLVLSDVADAPILERARRRGIDARAIGPRRFKPKLEPEFEADAARLLQQAQVDLVVLAGYMRVVKAPLLDAFGGRIINIHPALLPSFPGLQAWEQAIRYGVKISGCTVHLVDAGVDSGPIIMQQAVPVLATDTSASLHQRIQAAEHELFPAAIRLFAAGRLQVDGRTVRIRD